MSTPYNLICLHNQNVIFLLLNFMQGRHRYTQLPLHKAQLTTLLLLQPLYAVEFLFHDSKDTDNSLS